MNLETILPEGWKKPRGYANGILVPGNARWLHVAGQIAWDADCNLVGRGDFAVQFAQALGNVVAVVEAAGAEAQSLVSMTIYVTDKNAYLADLKGIGQTWSEIVGRHYPAMALVEVADLLEDGAMVEIEARAAFL